jgi:alkanesulfonate monooxygenase SsuD/methylene tetrahydromethanopterin reductase-like flavin-dependent oxidoreductase (luciferase family)
MVRVMTRLKSGVVISAGTPREFADLAVAAEKAGWEAIFTFEGVWGQDAWVTLTAAAMVTEKIRVGTMLTPLARNRPWELAGKVATLDNLSGGRVQLAVGMGALHPGWLAFEADEGRKVRAEKLDEGLAIYDGLMHGQPFSFSGKHYHVTPTDFLTPPPQVQQPRVPVWVVGAYPSAKSLGRAAKWDGLLSTKVGFAADTPFGPADLSDVVAAVRPLREEAGLPWEGYDVVAEGVSDPATADEQLREWVDAGATWWVESDWSMGEDAVARHRARIDAGPPAP